LTIRLKSGYTGFLIIEEIRLLSDEHSSLGGAYMKTIGPYCILITLFVFLSGCTGIHYADKVNAVDITLTDKQETSSRVLAAAGEWRNSGVIVKKGSKYRITATGKWTAGPICGWTGPDGIGASYMCTGATATYMGVESASTLIGKIGERGDPFVVGSALDLTASEEEGILYFRINDTTMMMHDNRGSVDVSISLKETGHKLAAAPVPAAEIRDDQKIRPSQPPHSSAQK
jgi:hypothetical protein